MTKPYFAKYTITEGEIKEGDMCLCLGNGLITKIRKNIAWAVNNEHHRKVVLSLCTNEIEKGDTFYSVNRLDTSFLALDVIDGTIHTRNYPLESFIATANPYIYKILGQLSEIGIKEGDRFDETDLERHGISLKDGFSIKPPSQIIDVKITPKETFSREDMEKAYSHGLLKDGEGFRKFMGTIPNVPVIEMGEIQEGDTVISTVTGRIGKVYWREMIEYEDRVVDTLFIEAIGKTDLPLFGGDIAGFKKLNNPTFCVIGKPYFVKLLPTNEEIKEGDMCMTPEEGYFRAHNVKDGVPIGSKKVNLTLCTKDVKVGDEVVDSTGVRKRVDSKEYLSQLFTLINSHGAGKEIALLSPKAFWVTEGDEYEETELEFWHKDDNNSKYGFIIDPTIPSVRPDWQEWVTLVKVKGTCGYFH